MGQEQGSRSAEVRQPAGRGAVMALSVGLALTVIALVAAVVDQASVHGIADHVRALYGPHDLHPDPNVLFNLLYVTGAFGVLLWLVTIRGVWRQKRWPRVVGALVTVVATSLALLNLLAFEHGTQIFPTVWGVIGLLPCIAGVVAVILLWRQRPAEVAAPHGATPRYEAL